MVTSRLAPGAWSTERCDFIKIYIGIFVFELYSFLGRRYVFA